MQHGHSYTVCDLEATNLRKIFKSIFLAQAAL